MTAAHRLAAILAAEVVGRGADGAAPERPEAARSITFNANASFPNCDVHRLDPHRQVSAIFCPWLPGLTNRHASVLGEAATCVALEDAHWAGSATDLAEAAFMVLVVRTALGSARVLLRKQVRCGRRRPP